MIRIGRTYALFVIAFLAIAIAIRIADPFPVKALRLIGSDLFQRLEPEIFNPELPVRIVDIDDPSLAEVGQWPWPRTVVADLVKRLTEAGAASIAFDMVFPEADRNSPEQVARRLPEELSHLLLAKVGEGASFDSQLATVLSQSPAVTATVLVAEGAPPRVKAGFAIAGDDPKPFLNGFGGAVGNLAPLDEAASGIGAINWIPDRDQIVRRVPLVMRAGNALVPSLAAEALRVAQGARGFILKASNASGETAFGQSSGLNQVKIGDFEIPTDADGAIWLKYRASAPQSFLSAAKVLDGKIPPDEIAGRIILVGSSAAALGDLVATPLEATVPGVEIHAQILEHIIKGLSLTRPDYALAVEIVALGLIGLALGWMMPRIPASLSALAGASAVAIVLGGAWLAATEGGMLFDPLYPTIVLVLLVAAATSWVYRRAEIQRAEVRHAFGHYVAPAVVDELINHPERLELGGEVRTLTLMFSDVRSFTSISEKMTAHELTAFLNELLTPLSSVILAHRGTIDKFMGDGIMAFWNAPLDDPDHSANATRAALAMQAEVDRLNEEWQARAAAGGKPMPRVAIGIGLNSGECCVGNLGSAQRFDYSAIGDEVNVASRLEGITKQLGLKIIMGDRVHANASSQAAIPIGRIRVVGRHAPLALHTPVPEAIAGRPTFPEIRSRQERVLAAYAAGAWEEAIVAIAEARSTEGAEFLEGYYRRLSGEVERLKANPPADWDGVLVFLEK